MAIRNFLEGPRPSQPPQRRAGEIVSLLQNRLNMNITFKELQDGPAAARPPLGPHALTGHHQQGHPASSAGEGDQPVLQAWTAVGDCGRHGGAVLSL
uniref:Uncharacterized protein n=1 Tax=Oryza nivara TaxID=4536 RepID=A0A0E0FXY4_ORYNI